MSPGKKLNSELIKLILDLRISRNLGARRIQKTVLEEFYAITDLFDFDTLREELAQWQFFYNWQRPHGSLKGSV